MVLILRRKHSRHRKGGTISSVREHTMEAAGTKKPRSPERAKQVIDRAARSRKFRAPLVERRLFDKQMRTTGHGPPPFRNLHRLTSDHLEVVGSRRVPLSAIHTDQPTVSVSIVKKKIDRITQGLPVDKPILLEHKGKLHALSNNHTTTARRALGEHDVEAHIVRLKERFRL